MPAGVVRVTSAGVASVVGAYSIRQATAIPEGFAKVCRAQGWATNDMWKRLSDLKRPWFEADNGAYMYYNRADGQWWIDEPNGSGIYVSGSDTTLPPLDGWKPLQSGLLPLPILAVDEA